ncbi:MAG: stage III sporulation protein AB [Oscillospiraceae bacterium]|nr:stage III sporulation protein AB [Oscillospiraceae bacterium]
MGLTSVWQMEKRVRNLSGILTSLKTMKREICDRMTPMPELLEQLQNEADRPVDHFFAQVTRQMGAIGTRSFHSIWKAAVEQTTDLALTEREAQVLADLGRTLGRYDVEEQRSALDDTIGRIEDFWKAAIEERRSRGKVHAALGLVAGVFVVIILL